MTILKKRIFFYLVFIFMSVLFAGCGKDPVQADLNHYLNKEIKPLVVKERPIMNLFDEVTGANYTDDQTTYRVLTKDVLLQYQNFLRRIENIHPKTEEVQKAHQLYLKAVRKQQQNISLLIQALKEGDMDKAKQANQNLSEAEKLMKEYQQTIEELAKIHHVVLFEKNF